ncbi:helix-turn-helix domain-containing protein [Reyranella sp.]|uniref:helix-turn-helix domain-containing protein n=1 Tax=Reyranella sp. TaxID=1929291 RepID=UPI003D136398
MLKSVHTARHKLFCASLKRARKDGGLTQQDVAKKLHEHQSFVSRYETGERRLDVVEYLEICSVIGVDPSEHLRLLTYEWASTRNK